MPFTPAQTDATDGRSDGLTLRDVSAALPWQRGLPVSVCRNSNGRFEGAAA